MSAELLVVAGEASGDRAAAAVVGRLRGVTAFGLGGGALATEGVELLADLRSLTALGVSEPLHRAYSVGVAYARIRAAAARRKPKAALLVSYTEFNARLAEVLWANGTRVLWYAAPQIWAWRRGRAVPLRRYVDRMAVTLPFEEPLWRDLGVDAHYVGHPALEELAAGPAHHRPDDAPPSSSARLPEARVAARELLGLTPRAWGVALLPGSRPHEVRRLLTPMLTAYETVRHDRASVDGRLLLAPSLDEATRAWARSVASSFRVEVVDVDARAGTAYALPAFDVALCASGTASLECALARAVPIVCYRVGWATELGARTLMKTPWVALPNVLLGRAAFPELLQRNATAARIADTLERVLDDRATYVEACAEVEASLGARATASREVARMLEPWLDRPATRSIPAHSRAEAAKPGA